MHGKPRILWAIGFMVASLASVRADKPLPAHPNDIAYPPLDYQVPLASQFRTVLAN